MKDNFVKLVFLSFILSLTASNLQAQSGSWSGKREMAYDIHVTNGSGGYFDYGGGVIQLTNSVFSGCTASAVHSGVKYNHCDSNFSKCYQVLFGCGDADGLAFSFSYGCNPNNTDWQVWGCGGGLGYRNGCAWNQGVTIEFDTYNNTGGAGFDGAYAGVGNNDEIAIHRNLEATDAGKMTAVSVPDLEDGREHRVCINYDRVTHVISVTIDGINRITYDLDNGGLNPATYFSGCELMTTWSAGTNAGLNTQVVSDGASIYDYAGQLCPQMLPVEFLKVEAESISSSVILSWATAIEKNNKKFIIERSNDTSDWEALGEVSGAGNSGSVNNYSFIDKFPLNGTSYYRIKQIDFDDTHAYSNVVVVHTGLQSLNISPNPFEDGLIINTNITGEVEISIHDVLGKLLYHSNENSKDGILIINPTLPNGAYLITIQTDTFIKQQKIIKK